MAESPAGVSSPSSTATTPVTWRAFIIFCFLSPPRPLLYLNNNSLPFNPVRILSSQTRTQGSTLHWCAEDQETKPCYCRELFSLHPHYFKCKYWKDSCHVAANTAKRMCQGIQYHIPVLLASAYGNCFSIVKDIWCSSTQFLAHKKPCLSLERIGLEIYYSPPWQQLDCPQLEPIIPRRL